MDAKICDKCGKTFKEINQTAKISGIDENGGVMITGNTIWDCKPGIRITMKPITKSPFTKKHYDLCPECAEKIIEFFSSGTYPLNNDSEGKMDCLKPNKTISESLGEKLALPVEGAPNGPATDCKYCGRMIERREDIRACLNPCITSHQHCTYKCTKFEPKEEE